MGSVEKNSRHRTPSASPARRGRPSHQIKNMPPTTTSSAKTVAELTADIKTLKEENIKLKQAHENSGKLVAVAIFVCLAVGIYVGRNFFAETTEALQKAYQQNMENTLAECARNVSSVETKMRNSCQNAVQAVAQILQCSQSIVEENWPKQICDAANKY